MENPLHKEQYAYQEGKSADIALAEVVTEIQKGINSGFSRENEVPNTVKRWMRRLLVGKRVVAEWKQHIRWVLSPTMWYLVADKLLSLLSEVEDFIRAYAGNKGISEDLMRSALSIV